MDNRKILDDLTFVSRQDKKVFTLKDLSIVSGKSNKYLSKLLSTKRNVVRIENGKYFLDSGQGVDLYEISSQLVFPSYISLFAAFQYYSITDQVITTYSVVSLKRHRRILLGNSVIEFKSINKQRFFGYKKVGGIFVATIEKAIVDSLYFNTPSFSYVKEAFDNAQSKRDLNKKTLIEYAERMNSKIVRYKVEALLKRI